MPLAEFTKMFLKRESNLLFLEVEDPGFRRDDKGDCFVVPSALLAMTGEIPASAGMTGLLAMTYRYDEFASNDVPL